MYSGTHLAGWLGAAQCAGPMAAGERFANANSHSHSYAYSNAAAAYSYSHTSAGRWRVMRSGMEFHPCLLQYVHHHLQWWKHGLQERLELYCAILESGSGPDGRWKRRPRRIRRSVVYWCCLHHGRADSNSNAHSHTEAHSHAQSHSYANSATARQRDL